MSIFVLYVIGNLRTPVASLVMQVELTLVSVECCKKTRYYSNCTKTWWSAK